MTKMGYFMDWFWLALGLPDALPWKATGGEIPEVRRQVYMRRSAHLHFTDIQHNSYAT